MGVNRMSDWIWAGARAVGTSHLSSRTPCQDAFDCTIWRCAGMAPVLIAAVADGAGSASRSEHGSRIAATHFVETVHQAFLEGADPRDADEIIRYALDQVRLALDLVAGRNSVPVSDYATTLLVAVLSDEGGGAVAQVGDGAIVIDDGQGGWLPVHWPDHGEYANTTHFITEPDAVDMVQLTTFSRSPRHLCLFTDGIERLVLDFRQRTAHGPFFESIFRGVAMRSGVGHAGLASAAIEELLRSERVNARTDDDKSLLCAALIGA
jgi:hypothetical protein